MRAPRKDADLHIRKRTPCEYAPVRLFPQVREDQPLPVPLQYILAAERIKTQAAAVLIRLKEQMDFRIMPERLEMPDALHRRRNGFLINDRTFTKAYCDRETILQRPLQHLQLHFSHHTEAYPRAPTAASCSTGIFVFGKNTKLRILFFEDPQLCEQYRIIRSVFRIHAVTEHRLQKDRIVSLQGTEPHTRAA